MPVDMNRAIRPPVQTRYPVKQIIIDVANGGFEVTCVGDQAAGADGLDGSHGSAPTSVGTIDELKTLIEQKLGGTPASPPAAAEPDSDDASVTDPAAA